MGDAVSSPIFASHLPCFRGISHNFGYLFCVKRSIHQEAIAPVASRYFPDCFPVLPQLLPAVGQFRQVKHSVSSGETMCFT